MKVALLIITYTSPLQTLRLVKKLNNGSFDFYIHLDKKVNMETHSMLFNEPNVYFIQDRVDIKWASFTSIHATIKGIKQIEASGIKYDYINSLSGQDYPIKSADYILNFLEQNKGKEFIHYLDFEVWTGAQLRLDKYHLQDMNFKGKFRLQWLLNKLIKKRRMPKDFKLYGHSTFWTLTAECAFYMADVLGKNNPYERFLKYTFGSDEYIYPTVVMNSAFKNAVENNNYRYVDWSQGGYRPKTLVTADFEKIAASDCLFGRKFDINTDSNILDLIDNYNSK